MLTVLCDDIHDCMTAEPSTDSNMSWRVVSPLSENDINATILSNCLSNLTFGFFIFNSRVLGVWVLYYTNVFIIVSLLKK